MSVTAEDILKLPCLKETKPADRQSLEQQSCGDPDFGTDPCDTGLCTEQIAGEHVFV